MTGSKLTGGHHVALLYGTHEIVVTVRGRLGNPYKDVQLSAEFMRPDGSRRVAEAFYDGGIVYKIRAYCGQTGTWSWRLASDRSELDGLQGSFEVSPSTLPGKLRLHPDDSRQFIYANGDCFIHIGDTGYRYATDTEPYWREYIEQAAAAGFTKIRVWFSQGRSDVSALFQSDRSRMNLSYWQEMDRRIIYVLDRFPELQLQLIPFGEDEEEVIRCGEGDPAGLFVIRYMIARFAALPNVQWCFSNDLRLEGGDKTIAERGDGQRVELADRIKTAIRRIGHEFRLLDPWGTLMTNHQSRFSGYSFVDEPWSDIVTLEDLGQVTGEQIVKYRELTDRPIVLDEDRYEHWHKPQHVRYFFRRLMWASLLSGGHATYGGLHTYRPFDGGLEGMYGYYDACRDGKLEQGAHDFTEIRRFFRESGFSLAGAVPDDRIAGGRPLLYKAMRSCDGLAIVVYLANPNLFEGHAPDGFGGVHTDAKADVATDTPKVVMHLDEGEYETSWFHPSGRGWTHEGKREIKDGVFVAPGGGDWILLLRKRKNRG